MQSAYPARFERDMTTTEADWCSRLPGAVAPHTLQWQPGGATVAIGRDTMGPHSPLSTRAQGSGQLTLRWQVAAPRAIGGVRLPRLWAQFEFVGLDEASRHAFMRRFDLHLQRGGG